MKNITDIAHIETINKTKMKLEPIDKEIAFFLDNLNTNPTITSP